MSEHTLPLPRRRTRRHDDDADGAGRHDDAAGARGRDDAAGGARLDGAAGARGRDGAAGGARLGGAAGGARRDGARPEARPRARMRAWVLARPELLGLVVLAGALNLVALSQNGVANEYYAAAVKAMASSWHAFLYGSFDSSGVMTVDKPPLALWVQALSVRAFGFSSWSLLVPQALMGVASVALVYDIGRRAFGRVAGTVAGLALALTPIMVAVSRHNNPDALLILCSVAALWCLVRALDDGRTRWLVLSGVAVGLGFETKMAAALMVVPGIVAAYLWVAPQRAAVADAPTPGSPRPAAAADAPTPGSPRRADAPTPVSPRGADVADAPTSGSFRRATAGEGVAAGARLRAAAQLAAGGVAMLVVGLAWPLLIWVTPAADRPWISGTSDNSIWSLILGYNGLGRLFGQSGGPAGTGGMGGGIFGGDPGVLRLLNSSLGGQAGWLLGVALVAGAGLLWATRLRRGDVRSGALIATGGAFLVTAVAFSRAEGIFHPYYVSLLAPFTALLVGGGASLVLARGTVARVAGPAMVVAGALTEWYVLRESGSLAWLSPLLVGGGLGLAVLLALDLGGTVRRAAAVAATGLVLLAPAVWSAQTLGHATSGTFPAGGPASAQTMGGMGGGPRGGTAPSGGTTGGGAAQGGTTTGGGGMFGGDTSTVTAAVTYASANGGGTIAVASQSTAASVDLSDASAQVVGIGGFSGSESEVTLDWLADQVETGQIRYVVVGGTSNGGFSDGRVGASEVLAAAAKVGKAVSSVDGLYDLQGTASALRAAAT